MCFFIFLLKGFYHNGFIGNVLIYLTENKWQYFLTSTLGHPKNFPKNFHQIMGQ